ncbi:ferredoxin reductase [Pseudofrankia asymbiotica]|uniref:Ferredoxin reductase n=1 Tax=Pseudofrankia asymbiotica TaxID=1834516 RepID=A0A1V2IFU1_9ACTN|nr:ferredoxin reductase [Pseudofrankia asymbiotica]
MVVVGAGLAGLRTAEGLRRHGWEGLVTVVGDEAHMPYTRPPLSKKLLLEGGDHASVELRRRACEHPTEWRLGRRAVAADLDRGTVTLDDGTELAYEGLVAATGVRPRRLPDSVGGPRTVLRTLDDALALGERLTPGARVVVIGAGFIGCEVAATALSRGCQVCVVAIDDVPMRVPLGPMVGAELRRRHADAGVFFHLGLGVDAVDGSGVVLSDGTRLDADVVVEAIGSRPATDWLEGNGLDLADGVACDGFLRLGGRPRTVGVGDVARFPNALYDGAPRRVEHWQVAVDTGMYAAATLVADLTGTPPEQPFRTVPTFWSDQAAVSLRALGQPGLGTEVEVLEGDLAGDAAIGYRRDGTLVGVLLLGMPRRMGVYLRRLTTELEAARA